MPHLSPQTLTHGEQKAILRATARHLRDHLIYSLALGTVGVVAGHLLESVRERVEKRARLVEPDGLTDLAEERLITDPQSPDTDGDGLLDGNDSLPQVPWTAVMDDSARALDAVLGRITHMESMSIIHEIPEPGDKSDDIMVRARKATLTGERTAFFVADRQDFRSLLTTRRAVVLTAAELELAEKKFGRIFAYRLPLFVLDHEQRRGYVIWDASWVGGALKLRRSSEDWELETVSDWIT